MNIHGLGNGELERARIIDGNYAAFPELDHMSE